MAPCNIGRHLASLLQASELERIYSAFLQGQPDTQRTIDAADGFALSFEHGRVPAQEVAESSRADRENQCAQEAEQDEDDSQDRQLNHDRPVLGPHELGQEGEEEERGLRIEHLGQDRLPECAACRDRQCLGRKRGRSLLQHCANTEIDEISGPDVFDDAEEHAEVAMIAEMPTIAMKVWITSPATMPAPVATPTFVPELVARATVSSVAGPGMNTKPSTMAM